MADHRRVKDLDREVGNRWDTEDTTREADLEVEDGEEDGRVVSILFNFVCIFASIIPTRVMGQISRRLKMHCIYQDMAVSINGCFGQFPRGKGACVLHGGMAANITRRLALSCHCEHSQCARTSNCAYSGKYRMVYSRV